MLNNKVLVSYFSCSGVTQRVAKKLAQAATADLYEIEPMQKYSSADLNWNDNKSRSSIEMNDKTCRPKMVHGVIDMNHYDVVFVGFPIWWYDAPRIIATFLESYDFSGKTVIPFATSGGSGFSNSINTIKNMAPEATVLEGLSLSSHATTNSTDAVTAWLVEQGMTQV